MKRQASAIRVFVRGIRTQKRVLGALIMRDVITRWGRRNLGFAWVFVEPLSFAVPVLLIWRAMRGDLEHGLPLTAFLWSGYLPILLFRHATNSSIGLIRGSSGLLYHHCVTPLDAFTSNFILDLVGSWAAMAFSFALFYLFGAMDLPENLGLFLGGIGIMAWWALSMALIVACLSERSEAFAHIWQTISYIYFIVCGFFFLCVWLPDKLRDLALATMPSVHAYEMIRAGLFGSKFRPYYDVGYVSFYLAIVTVIGLWLMRDVREHLEID